MINFLEKIFKEDEFENIAIIFEQKEYSFRELYEDVNRYSQLIKAKIGYKHNQKIAFIFQKSYNSICILLAIISSGNIYVPLNKKTPIPRLEKLIIENNIKCLISDEELNIDGIELKIYLNELCPQIESCNNEVIHYVNSIEDYAYIIFTSGSTGQPKAVGITFENLLSFLDSMKSIIEINKNDRVSFFADYSFDFSIAEIFMTLFNGACLVIPNTLEKRNPLKFVQDNRVSVWMSVPSYANYCMELNKLKKQLLRTLRLAIFCGEGLSVELANSWTKLSPFCEIYNAYGPTEATVFSTIYKFNPEKEYDNYLLPIGTNLKNITSKIIEPDESGIGELCLKGKQVFKGYLYDNYEIEWYKTGDMVYKDLNGDYNFIGRKDSQIKRNGYRIDINEIKKILMKHGTGIEFEIIDIREKEIVKLYFIFRNQSQLIYMSNIIDKYLDFYMKPDEMIVLNEFPLNFNGKLDNMAIRTIIKALE